MWRYNVALKRPERIPDVAEEASTSAEVQPTCFDTAEFGKFLDVSKDKLSVRYTGNGLHDNDVGSIQANAKVPRRQLVYYYEMTVLDAGTRGLIAIGFAEKGFKLGRHPGWEPNSYGYHAEEGKKLTGVVTPFRNSGEEYGPGFAAGDTVGAGILLESQEMFFTLNGKNLGVAFKNVLKLPLYPTIGLHSRHEHVKVNFGQQPFEFDVDSLVQAERHKREQAVLNVHVPSGDVHQIVRNFLLQNGYSETLRSFVECAGLASPSASQSATGSAEVSLPLRADLRRKILAGQVEEAYSLARDSGLLSRRQGKGLDVYFFVKCQAFIELVRKGDAEAAIQNARSVLSPLRGMFASSSAAYDAMLADVVALLVYEKPEDSPMRRLLSQAQREAVADMVNCAILEATTSASSPRQCQCTLERLLHQLVAVQHELHAANGGHGQVFRLSDHLQLSAAGPLPPANGVAGHTNGFGHAD